MIIKDLVFEYINRNIGLIDYDELTDLILTEFPNSRWKETHWAWYKNHILNPKGKFYNMFSEQIKNNLISKKKSIPHYSNNKPSEVRKFMQLQHYIFEDKSEDVERDIAFALGKSCYYIHPKIVEKITKANLNFKNEFQKVSGSLNLDIFFYFNSDCVFPGVRRNINSEKIGKWKNNINKADNIILNDNTLPRHIWAFLSMNKPYEGNMWKGSELNKFELAHIFGHKTGEKELEQKVFKKFDKTKLPYALFTSASNVILIPNGLMKPTDKFESIKIAFYKRHFDLYCHNLYGEEEFDESFVPKWYSEIKWLEPPLPNGWETRIDNLLEYRRKVLINKYITSR